MQINLNKISDKDVASTGVVKSMGMSDNAQGIIFQMFTSNIYSNPIGTVVREITSNCFDSHIEADVNKPVVLKLTKDNTTETHYISFIDFGVGMSPQRVEEIYTVYFESTKRDNNDEIGGFGIGGKTPLAYKRYTYAGKGEYDNSFFVITKYNGVKYTYSIFEGEKSPQYILLSEEPTKDHNGTEIKIPVLEQDIYKFESEIIKQLYYFENLVFEGFSDRVTNDYKIYKGENFLYRGNNVSDFIHVCLGRVAYPIDYSVLDIDKYDYKLPVAINVPIGAINVVASREQLDYSDATIDYLKSKLNLVKEELKSLLEKQSNTIESLTDYYFHKKNIFKLYLTDNEDDYIDMSSVIDLKDIHLNNYKYKNDFTPSFDRLFDLFCTKKRYGVIEKKRYYNETYEVFNGKFDQLTKENVFFLNDKNFKINRRLSSYLKQEHGRFYVISLKDIENVEDNFDLKYILKNDTPTHVKNMYDDTWNVITEFANDIQKVVIPADFSVKQNIPKNKYIPIQFSYYNDKDRVLLEKLVKFKGTIFYAETEDKEWVKSSYNIFNNLFSDKHVIMGNHQSFTDVKKNIMFISLAKNNVRYLKHCTQANVHEITDGYFYRWLLRRKEDLINEFYKKRDILDLYEEINSIYTISNFNKVNEDVYNCASNIESTIRSFKNFINDYTSLQYNRNFIKTLGINIDYKYTKDDEKLLEDINYMNKINEKNKEVILYLYMPSYQDLNETQIKILKKLLKF